MAGAVQIKDFEELTGASHSSHFLPIDANPAQMLKPYPAPPFWMADDEDMAVGRNTWLLVERGPWLTTENDQSGLVDLVNLVGRSTYQGLGVWVLTHSHILEVFSAQKRQSKLQPCDSISKLLQALDAGSAYTKQRSGLCGLDHLWTSACTADPM